MSKDGKIEKMKCHLRTTKKKSDNVEPCSTQFALHNSYSSGKNFHACNVLVHIGSTPAGDQILSRT